MAKQSGVFKLDSICAKLKNNKSEVNNDVVPNSGISPSQNGLHGIESSVLTLKNEHDINSNGIKDSMHNKIPSGTTVLDTISSNQEMAKLDMSSTRQSDLTSSSGSSQSSASLVDDISAAKFVAGPMSFDSKVTNSDAINAASLKMDIKSEPLSNRRKNRRKNTAPKNLVQMREMENLRVLEKTMETNYELKAYQVNNPDVDFMAASKNDLNETYEASLVPPRAALNDDVEILDLSSSKPTQPSSAVSKDSTIRTCSDDFNTDDYGVLDLSTGGPPTHGYNLDHMGDSESHFHLDGEIPTHLENMHHNKNTPLSNKLKSQALLKQPRMGLVMQGTPHGSNSKQAPSTRPVASPERAGAEASQMKDFAENTVNELLSMYGLGEIEAQSVTQDVTRDVPLQNFASGNILRWNKSKPPPHLPFMQSEAARKKTLAKDGPKDDLRSLSPASLTKSNEDEGEGSASGSYQSSKIGAMYSPLKSESNYPEYGKYVSRYRDWEQCGQVECTDAHIREHFHCRECPSKIFLKKDEMIRHFKWHRKRDESLQHGFMRYSPLDDCGKRFIDCAHNGKQTHYHCIQPGCSKVYISTSDVQMHANYHRKDSAIMQQGFQRFRATEDCDTASCPFYGQRTTHFHCRRTGCNFSFKNKADIDKHKTFHQKDDILAKDGFKKFMKYDTCNFSNCRYSKISNHIHCIRPGCEYVLHSTSQLLSHKRKHERREIEFAYRKSKDTSVPNQSNPPAMLNPALLPLTKPPTLKQPPFLPQLHQIVEMTTPEDSSDLSLMEYLKYSQRRDINRQLLNEDSRDDTSSPSLSESRVSDSGHVMGAEQERGESSMEEEDEEEEDELNESVDMLSMTHPGAFGVEARPKMDTGLSRSINLPLLHTHTQEQSEADSENRADSPLTGQSPAGFVPKTSPPVNEKRERDETWKKYLTRYTANDPCHSRCQFLYKDHYHCNSPACGILFRSKDGVRDHARHHENLERITELSYMLYSPDKACVESCPHYLKLTHYHCLWTGCDEVIPDSAPIFQRLDHFHIHEYSRANGGRKPIAGFFKTETNMKRKRGRPPKYPKQDIPIVPKLEMDENSIRAEAQRCGNADPIAYGYKKYERFEPCQDNKCMYYLKEHFHCVRQRCHHATDNEDVLNLHDRDFHHYVNILEGFEFFDRNVNCRRPHCHNNKVNRHFHCVRPKCDYSFVRYSTMSQHDKKHRMAEMGFTVSPGVAIPSSSLQNEDAMIDTKSLTSHTAPIHSATVVQGTCSLPLILPSKTLPQAASGYIPMSIAPGHNVMSTGQLVTLAPASSAVVTPMVQAGGLEPITTSPIVSPIVIQPIDEPPSPQVLVKTQLTSPHKSIPLLPKPAELPQTTLPLASLLQQKGSNLAPQMNWTAMLVKMHYSINTNCGRPFCKLKKKDHYHCFDCNQAFCDPIRLKSHAVKHGLILDKSNNISGRFLPRMSAAASASIPTTIQAHNPPPANPSAQISVDTGQSSEEYEDDDHASSLNLNPMEFTNMLQKSQNENLEVEPQPSDENILFDIQATLVNINPVSQINQAYLSEDMSEDEDESCLKIDENATSEDFIDDSMIDTPNDSDNNRRSTRKRTLSHNMDADVNEVVAPKKARGGVGTPKQSSRPRRHAVVADIPEGFEKFCSNEDCGLDKCTYRLTITHYHCSRPDCIFGTADRNRLVQHIERHRRTDDILGSNFRQFRLSQDCTRPACEHSGRGTHYHCLKCSFICLELSKVQAHRKHHQKQEAISAQGFLKVMASETCSFNSDGCSFSGRQTHYHCLQKDGTCKFIAHGQQAIVTHNKSVHGV